MALKKNLKDYLLPYQRRFVEDRSQLKIWLAARQVGKSTAVSFEAVELAVESKCSILLVSASERQSRELLEKVKIWLEISQVAIEKDILTKKTSEEIRLINGSRIISLPANPDTIRGFSGHVFLDEFAFHKDSRKIWASVFPIATRGYKIRITSTPNGKQNLFYELWEHSEGFSKHKTTIYDAVRDGLKVDIEFLRQGTSDEEAWQQEYECKFLDEATAFLTYEMINKCEVEKCLWDKELRDRIYKGEIKLSNPLYLGMDIGRKRDLTVIIVAEKIGDVLWVREIKELKSTPFHIQKEELFYRLSVVTRSAIDSTGIGMQLAEEAREAFGKYKVEEVNFSIKVKEEIGHILRMLFEDNLIRIPQNRELREDLHSIRKTITSGGHIRLDAERIEGSHADRFWALGLCAYAGAHKPMFSYKPIKVKWL